MHRSASPRERRCRPTWADLQRRLLLELGRDNCVARAVFPPDVLRWIAGSPLPMPIPTRNAPESAARLAVSPNPLPSTSMMHPVSVCWETGDGAPGEVWMSRDGGPETLLARGQGGTQTIASLATTSGYVFSLYTGPDATILRRSLPVLPAPAAPDGHARRFMQAALTVHLARRVLHQRLHLWWYYIAVRAALRRLPHLLWRAPAAAGACVRMLLDGSARALARGLSEAFGQTSPRTRWKLRWSLCYQYEAEQWLEVQAEKITPEWLTSEIGMRGSLPPDGAILISVHHLMRWLSYLRLGIAVEQIGTITMEPPLDIPAAFAQADPVTQRKLRAIHDMRARGVSWRDFHWHSGGREILRFLRAGGYVVFMVDVFIDGWPLGKVFNKVMPIPRGPIWFAEQTGKPIIPFMLVPTARGWELQFEEPIAPTQEAIMRALEGCVRRAPGMWRRDHATAWLQTPGDSPP